MVLQENVPVVLQDNVEPLVFQENVEPVVLQENEPVAL